MFSNFRASCKFHNQLNHSSRFIDEETWSQSCVRTVSKMLSPSYFPRGCQIYLSKVNIQQIASLLETFQIAITYQMTADCPPSAQTCPLWLLLMPLPASRALAGLNSSTVPVSSEVNSSEQKKFPFLLSCKAT